uniref:Uncharacterized protein n=1 Tax=Trichobilharzia regenti TaxID=157069 RepID=A0AA85K1X4_TRIRE|nr:unnamed protein product [Trichobilharzia regenti]
MSVLSKKYRLRFKRVIDLSSEFSEFDSLSKFNSEILKIHKIFLKPSVKFYIDCFTVNCCFLMRPMILNDFILMQDGSQQQMEFWKDTKVVVALGFLFVAVLLTLIIILVKKVQTSYPLNLILMSVTILLYTEVVATLCAYIPIKYLPVVFVVATAIAAVALILGVRTRAVKKVALIIMASVSLVIIVVGICVLFIPLIPNLVRLAMGVIITVAIATITFVTVQVFRFHWNPTSLLQAFIIGVETLYLCAAVAYCGIEILEIFLPAKKTGETAGRIMQANG